MGYIGDVFGPGGYLSQYLEGYEERPGQVKMAENVDIAIKDEQHLLVEAFTGTGKSLAYGVPAAYYGKANRDLYEDLGEAGEEEHERQHVIVVTSNIALQEQLIHKDFPLLTKIVPWDFSYALAKGRSNYLCRHLYNKAVGVGLLDLDVDLSEPERENARIVSEWGKGTETGDASELPFKLSLHLRRVFTTSSADCLKNLCGYCASCFCNKARSKARDSDVIVCNYHLFFAHLKIREEMGSNVVLPASNIVILDEAHEAARIARGFFGRDVSYGSIEWASRLLKGEWLSIRLALLDEARVFFERLEDYRMSNAYDKRLKVRNAVSWEGLYTKLNDVVGIYRTIIERTSKVDERTEYVNVCKRCLDIMDDLNDIMNLADGNSAYSIEETKGRLARLKSEPIYVHDRLKEELFQKASSVICTSATLTTGKGSFDYIERELGVPRVHKFIVQSPFNFAEQAIFVHGTSGFDYDKTYLSMPWAVNNSVYNSSSAKAFKKIIKAAQGRTLGLFTSYKSLNFVADRLCRDSDLSKWNIFVQGDKPRMQLLKEFKEDVNSVLLGTTSFWSGVDVPGEALSCVVMDKLPFPNPSSPVQDALSEKEGSNYFWKHSLPHAVIMFKQGFGRLIRTKKDRGVVVLLDPRLSDLVEKPKGYRISFIYGLPRMFRSHGIGDIEKFFANSNL